MPAKPTLKMDRGELGAEAGRIDLDVKALPWSCPMFLFLILKYHVGTNVDL